MPLTDLSFLDKYSTWPPPQESSRLARYATNKKLWDGDHDEVFGNWWKVLREDKEASLELIFNWHQRLSVLWADLLVGEPPRFLATDEDDNISPEHQDHLDRLTGKDDNGYVTVLQETAIDISRFGDGIQKITLEEEGAAIWPQPPSYWFPVVDPTNLRRFTHHVLAWEIEKKEPRFLDPGHTERYLWIEIHHRGAIEYRLHNLDSEYIMDPHPPSKLDPSILEPFVQTNVDDFLVVPFSGLRASDEIYGVDDYKKLDSVISAIEVRAGLINWILDKHSDPSLYGPADLIERNARGEYVFRAGSKFFPVSSEDGEEPPGYVTWDGQLEAAFRELDFLLEQLYVISETSPAAFGQQKEGLAESGSALRRLMMAPLAKVARMTMRIDPAARRALRIAALLENKNGRGTPELEHVLIQWQDGLPADPEEQARTEQIRTGNKPTSSQTTSIRRLDGGTQEEAEAELDRMKAEDTERAKAALDHAVALNATKPDPPQDEQGNGPRNTQADEEPRSSGSNPFKKE